jgi:hypothetical protein
MPPRTRHNSVIPTEAEPALSEVKRDLLLACVEGKCSSGVSPVRIRVVAEMISFRQISFAFARYDSRVAKN